MKAIHSIIVSGLVALGATATANPEETPARFLSDDVEDRLGVLLKRMAIMEREQGPFGLYQVPGKKPIIVSPIRTSRTKTPFGEYINRIQISVVNAKEKEFLVGARLFRLGQVFPIERGGEKLSVQVMAVEPSRVSFKNLKTGEVALRRLDSLPAGVTASAGKIQVRGVTPSNKGESEPLRLDFDSPDSPSRR